VSEPCQPFLKWPGGKRWAAPAIASLIREALSPEGTFFEPFVGGGAIFFYFRPCRAVLADVNAELVETYQAVRDAGQAVLRALRRLKVSEEEYYRIRATKPRRLVTRAARFLYLNRTAFGGVYRLNRNGAFNVPYGGGDRTPALLWKTGLLEAASVALAGVDLRHSDFEAIVDEAGLGDVVYCDPTYTVAHDNNGFRRYNERNFSWADQERLARAAERAVGRGATVLVSNAHHDSIAELYADVEVHTLRRKSRMSAKPDKRRDVSEYLLVLRPGARGSRRSTSLPLAPSRSQELRERSR
jgi:DNA adenine methylase